MHDALDLALNLVRQDASVAWGYTGEGPSRSLFSLQEQLAVALGEAIADQTPSRAPVKPAGGKRRPHRLRDELHIQDEQRDQDPNDI